jgi:hypothetical protein
LKARDQRKRPKYQSLKRLLHFADGSIWSYDIRGDNVLIRTPDHRTTYKADVYVVCGIDTSDWEPGDYEDWTGPSCEPWNVKAFIRKNYL